MASAGSSKWLAFGGAILIAAIAADSLVPVAWQVRSGLHWLTEHFLAYLAATSIFCLALQRPVIVVGVAMALAALMEGLQGLTADPHSRPSHRLVGGLPGLSPGAAPRNSAHKAVRAPKGPIEMGRNEPELTIRDSAAFYSHLSRANASVFPESPLSSEAGLSAGISLTDGYTTALPVMSRTVPTAGSDGMGDSTRSGDDSSRGDSSRNMGGISHSGSMDSTHIHNTDSGVRY
jgi:hypothetical protein